MKISEKQRIALVLGGGGVKAAAYHIGVCLALQEKGFHFMGGTVGDDRTYPQRTVQIYVGSSAGALVASILASGYSVESLIEAFEMGLSISSKRRKNRAEPLHLKALKYRDIFSINGPSILSLVPNLFRRRSLIAGGIEAFFKTGYSLDGLFTTNGLEKYLRTHVFPTNDFRELRAKLFVSATQLNHSRKVIFGSFDQTTKSDDIKWANFSSISQSVAASASLPPVFAPYGIQNQKGKMLYFYDGEIRDTLSNHVATDQGADLVIASYCIQPYHYHPDVGSLHSRGVPAIINQALNQLVEQKIIRHIQHQKDLKLALSIVDNYFKKNELPESHREKLNEILCERLQFRPEVDSIYIHPETTDYKLFFYDHFSLNPTILGDIVRIGFKNALRVLRRLNL